MRNFQKSQARKILKALGETRRALASPVAPGRAELARQQNAQRTRDKELTAALKRGGLDLAPLKALKPARFDPLAQWKKHQTTMGRRSALAAKTLRQTIDSRRAALKGLVAGPLLGITPRPFYVVLDMPFLMTRSYGLVIDDSHTEPWNNWAKVRTSGPATQGSGSIELSFYHVWQNTSGFPATVDVHSYLVLNGGAAAWVSGTFFPDSSRHSDLSIDVHVYPWEWWNQPPSTPLAQPDQSQNVMSLHQGGSGWLSEFDLPEQEQDVYRGYDLSYRSWDVPSNAFTVIETCMSLTFSNQDGGLLVDFSGRSQNSVMSAAVLLYVVPRWDVVAVSANA